jgi:hypothetical protein
MVRRHPIFDNINSTHSRILLRSRFLSRSFIESTYEGQPIAAEMVHAMIHGLLFHNVQEPRIDLFDIVMPSVGLEEKVV